MSGIVEYGHEDANKTNSIEKHYGATVSETHTFIKDIPDAEYFDDMLEDEIPQSAARAVGTIVGRRQNGQFKTEVQVTFDSVNLGEIRWSFDPVSLQERTTVDVNGDPILITYPPSTDWASTIESSGGDVIHSFQYTTYEDQTGEADIFVPSWEITGTRSVQVAAGGIVDYLTNTIRPWFNVINEYEFFGFEKGCVLCQGVGFRPVARRDDRSWICEERYKFLTKPGSPLSTWAAEGGVAGGWNSWHVWTDPNSGMIPDDVRDQEGAAVEVIHYALKDFRVLYQYS